jgi:hypothetical protein
MGRPMRESGKVARHLRSMEPIDQCRQKLLGTAQGGLSRPPAVGAGTGGESEGSGGFDRSAVP